MVTKLLVPDRRIVVPKPPSYLKLDMAFAIGAGAKLMDKSRYRAHGTISGADWADGAHGRCLDFVSTVPDYVEIPAAYTQLNFTPEDFSMVLRIKFDSVAITPYIFIRGFWNLDGYQVQAGATGYIIVYTFQAAANQASRTGVGSIVINTWYTIGFSRSGARVRVYINGVDSNAVSGVHIDPLTSTRSAKIGVFDNLIAQPLDGKIEVLKVFGGIALPASAHLAWHNALA